MAGRVYETNKVQGSVQVVTVPNRKNRLILWGGAYSKSDRYTFSACAQNLERLYKKKDGDKYSIFIREISGDDDLIEIINRQPKDSIRSLDIFTHGGEGHLWMVTVREGEDSSINDWKWWRGLFNSANFSQGDVSDLDYARFTVNTKIEIHGCSTAEDPEDADNLAADFSRALFRAGKQKSAVIGHTTKSNPLVKGSSTKVNEQSYMWQRRVVYRDGRIIKDTQEVGLISEEEISK